MGVHVIMNFCDIHKIPHTSSFLESNTFCLKCEMEPKGEPTVNTDGFRICAPPVGNDYRTYYAVVEQPWPEHKPQFVFIFKTADKARAEVDKREALDLDTTFIGITIESLAVCSEWFPTGMSKDMFTVWQPKGVPKVLNGNHGVYINTLVDSTTAKKIKQAKLKPKYGGSMNKKPVTGIPTNPTPGPVVTTPGGPSPVKPTPTAKPTKNPTVNKPAVKKPIVKKKAVVKKPLVKKKPAKKVVAKKKVATKKAPVKKTALKKPTLKKAASKKIGSTKKKSTKSTGSIAKKATKKSTGKSSKVVPRKPTKKKRTTLGAGLGSPSKAVKKRKGPLKGSKAVKKR